MNPSQSESCSVLEVFLEVGPRVEVFLEVAPCDISESSSVSEVFLEVGPCVEVFLEVAPCDITSEFLGVLRRHVQGASYPKA